jgi:hypothetical protein
MTDHHEPATVVTIPSPSSAFVPCLQTEKSNEPKSASLGKEGFISEFTQNNLDTVQITVPSPLRVEIHYQG